MKPIVRLLFVIAAMTQAINSSGAAVRRVPIYRTGITSDSVGGANIVVTNVYGSASAEIVSCSAGAAFALTNSGSTYKTIWHTAYNRCAAVAAGDVDGDGAVEVVVGTTTPSGGGAPSLLVYDPHRYAPPRANVLVPGTQDVTDVAFGNVDADSAPELVVVTASHAYVYDAATLALEWTATGRGGSSVAIGDLEGNGPVEIVVNGSTGSVLDAATKTLKWGYVGGFGNCMAVGDIDSDGKAEIVGGNGYGVRVVQGDTLVTTTFATSWYIQAIATGDGDNNGPAEIVTGDDQWGEIRGWTAAGVQLWYANNPEHGVSGVAIGDPDGDGVNEAVWGAGYTSSGTDSVFVGNTSTHQVEWSAPDQDGTFHAAAADLDGDGDVEIVVGMYSSDSGYAPGKVEIHDLQGNVVASMTSTSYNFRVFDVATGQLDSDPALEVAVLGGGYYGGELYVFDGVTHLLEWSTTAVYGGANFSQTAPFLIRNVDGDAVEEIIIATTDSRVLVLNGASPIVQASSSTLDNQILEMDLADLDGDSVQDLVIGTYAGFYVLRASNLTERIHTSLSGYKHVAATAGAFAIAIADSPPTLISYSGSTLLEQWRCSSLPSIQHTRYVTLDGVAWLAVADVNTLQFYPTGGAACPTKVDAEQPVTGLEELKFADVTGDGKPELLLPTYSQLEVDLIGFDTDPRGDADGDGNAFDNDMDALARYFYGDGEGIDAGADVDGDFALRPDDLIYLINYRRGTGAPPPQ